MPKKPAETASPEAVHLNKRSHDVSSILSQLNTQFGAMTVMRLTDQINAKVESISSGNIAIDAALGVGGLPKGRIVEIFGPESSGKTTMALTFVAQAQREGGIAAFIDVEHALDPKFAKIIGVDIDQLLVSQPDCGEDALTIAEILIRSNSVDIIVIDSVAALVTKKELEGEMGDATMGSQARLMSQAMRRLTACISKTKTVCVFTNQIREKIGVQFGNPEYQPGGRALKFFSSLRLDVRRRDSIKSPEGAVLGFAGRLKVVKNKVAPPFREAEYELLFNQGISPESSLIAMGLEHRILEKKGAWITYKGELLGQGQQATRAHLKAHPEAAQQIYSEIHNKLVELKTISMPLMVVEGEPPEMPEEAEDDDKKP